MVPNVLFVYFCAACSYPRYEMFHLGIEEVTLVNSTLTVVEVKSTAKEAVISNMSIKVGMVA